MTGAHPQHTCVKKFWTFRRNTHFILHYLEILQQCQYNVLIKDLYKLQEEDATQLCTYAYEAHWMLYENDNRSDAALLFHK